MYYIVRGLVGHRMKLLSECNKDKDFSFLAMLVFIFFFFSSSKHQRLAEICIILTGAASEEM